ncbi:MAG: aminotransferase class V-fold PLP-dependent enzyme [Emergencia sp.]
MDDYKDDYYKDIKSQRNNFPAAENSDYLLSAATGLVPSYVFEGINRFQEARYRTGGDSVWDGGLTSLEMMDKSRASIASMLNCEAEDIVFGMNTSHIMSMYSANVEFAPGANVVVPENLYNSGKFMFQVREREGLEIRYAKTKNGLVSAENIIAQIDSRTIAVACALVDNETGQRIEAEKIGEYCQKSGVFFILDCAQACGALKVDVKELHADLAAACDYKWMMNYFGTGFGYMSRRMREALHVKSAGWMSDAYRFEYDMQVLTPRDDGGMFDIGYPNMPGIFGLGLVAEKYCELGGDRIQQYIFMLRERLIERLNRMDAVTFPYMLSEDQYSQIVRMEVPADTGITEEKMKAQGIMCSVGGQNTDGKISVRVGIHYYNNEKDIDSFTDELEKFLGGLK